MRTASLTAWVLRCVASRSAAVVQRVLGSMLPVGESRSQMVPLSAATWAPLWAGGVVEAQAASASGSSVKKIRFMARSVRAKRRRIPRARPSGPVTWDIC